MFTLLKIVVVAALSLVPLASGETHLVVVGEGGGLTFTPSNLTAVVGDVIEFMFVQKNHSATQTSFETPCTPAEGGFDSGFNPVAAGQTTNFPTFNVTVENTDPIWVSCQQINHCKLGMAFAANPPADETFAEFVARAEAS